MEEIMLETGADLDIILGKVQRQMENFTISNHDDSSLSWNKDKKTCHTKNQGVGGDLFKGTIVNIKNDPIQKTR